MSEKKSLSQMLFMPNKTDYGDVNTSRAQTDFAPGSLFPGRTKGVVKLNRFAKVYDHIMDIWQKCTILVEPDSVRVVMGGRVVAYAEGDATGISAYPKTSWTNMFMATFLLFAKNGLMPWTTQFLSQYCGTPFDYTTNEAFTISDGFYFELKKLCGTLPVIEILEDEPEVAGSVYDGSVKFLQTMAKPVISKKRVAKAPSESSTAIAQVLKDCAEGKYLINYEWSDEEKELIPPRSIFDTFMVTPSFTLQLKMLHRTLTDPEHTTPYNGVMYGTPSAGKSYNLRALAAALGLPMYIVTQKPHTEEDTYEGMVKVHEGKWDFVMTPFLKGFKGGGIIALEEFNLTDPGVLQGALSQALESPYILLEDGIRSVSRHPLCAVIGTMNPNVAGAHEMNDAFMSRLRQQVEVKEASKDIILAQISGLYPDADKRDVEMVYADYRKAKECLELNGGREYDDKLTLRHVYAIIERVLAGYNVNEAAQDVLVSAVRLTGDYEIADLLESALKGTR